MYWIKAAQSVLRPAAPSESVSNSAEIRVYASGRMFGLFAAEQKLICSGISWCLLVSAGSSWIQLVSAGFSWFQILSAVSAETPAGGDT